MTNESPVALAIHGGAGARRGRDYTIVETHLMAVLTRGKSRLENGDSALDVVEACVVELERSGYYIAGKGSAPNKAGYAELDASIMAGETPDQPRNAGAVAAVRNLKSPITAARAVMEETYHVMLAGEGAANFCREINLDFVDDPQSYYVTPIGVNEEELYQDELGHGTVGAVALDNKGRLAAGTSTGGVFGKREGRVGDTPLIGAGTWADDNVSASCTGLGEFFVLAGGAQRVADAVRFGGAALKDAAGGLIEEVGALGGDGGIIAINKTGALAFEWNSDGMKHAGFGPDCPPFVRIF